MATKPKQVADKPTPVKPQSRAQLGKSLTALAGLASPQKQKLPGGKGR
jgi:hypothetical protein